MKMINNSLAFQASHCGMYPTQHEAVHSFRSYITSEEAFFSSTTHTVGDLVFVDVVPYSGVIYKGFRELRLSSWQGIFTAT